MKAQPEPTSWKVLMLPPWMLSVSFAMSIVIIQCAGSFERRLGFAFGWMIFNTIPVFTLLKAYDKERAKRKEIELRWRKDTEKAFH